MAWRTSWSRGSTAGSSGAMRARSRTAWGSSRTTPPFARGLAGRRAARPSGTDGTRPSTATEGCTGMRMASVALSSLRRPRAGDGRALVVLGIVAAVVVGYVAITRPDLYRFLLAVAIVANLLLILVRWPRAAILLTLMYLPFMALTRRLLIDMSGWSSYDPLLLVAPVVGIVLCWRLFVRGGATVANDRLSKLVAGLLALLVLQAFNPLGGGVFSGIAGLLFMAMPLLWFFIGRELVDRPTAGAVMGGAVVVALIVGIYGYIQTEIVEPSWDKKWVDVAGYAALHVGDKIRAFGTFASSAEYALYLAVGIAIAFAFVLHGRFIAGVAAAALMVPLALASARGAMVFTLIALVAALAFRTRRSGTAAATFVLGLALLLGALFAAGPAMESAAKSSGNDLLIHQAEGLAHPFDRDKSTLPTHWDLVLGGFSDGFTQPLGKGTGATNIAASKFGGDEGTNTEIDITNTFVALGLVGGLMYVAVIVLSFGAVLRNYFRTGDPLRLGVAAVLVATLVQWLQGWHYAIAPLMWLLLGWASRPLL